MDESGNEGAAIQAGGHNGRDIVCETRHSYALSSVLRNRISIKYVLAEPPFELRFGSDD